MTRPIRKAIGIPRGLVDKMVIRRGKGDLEIELVGEIANMVAPSSAQNVPTTGQFRSSVKVVAVDCFKRISCKTEALFSLGFWRAAGIGRVQTAAHADSRKAIAARSKGSSCQCLPTAAISAQQAANGSTSAHIDCGAAMQAGSLVACPSARSRSKVAPAAGSNRGPATNDSYG